jgi:hypothetical protein
MLKAYVRARPKTSALDDSLQDLRHVFIATSNQRARDHQLTGASGLTWLGSCRATRAWTACWASVVPVILHSSFILRAIAARLRSETALPIKLIAARVQIGTAKGAKSVLHLLAQSQDQR